MAAPTRSAFLTCTLCGTSVDRPAAGQWAGRWEEGWRWIGSQNLYSCPTCPPMILVADDGTHHTGPGVEAAAAM